MKSSARFVAIFAGELNIALSLSQHQSSAFFPLPVLDQVQRGRRQHHRHASACGEVRSVQTPGLELRYTNQEPWRKSPAEVGEAHAVRMMSENSAPSCPHFAEGAEGMPGGVRMQALTSFISITWAAISAPLRPTVLSQAMKTAWQSHVMSSYVFVRPCLVSYMVCVHISF